MDAQLTSSATPIPESYNSNHMMPPKSPGVQSKRSSYGSTRANLGSDSEEEDTLLGPKIRQPKRKTPGHSKKGKRATSLQPPDFLAVVAELPGDAPTSFPSPVLDTHTPDSSYGSMHVGDEPSEQSERDTTNERADINASNGERHVTSPSPELDIPTTPAFSDKIVCAVSVPIPQAAFRAAPVQVHVPLRNASSNNSLLSAPAPADPTHDRAPSISAISMISTEYTTGARVLSPVSEIFEIAPPSTVHRVPSRPREATQAYSHASRSQPAELMAERDATELDSVSPQQYQEFENRNSVDMSFDSASPPTTHRWSALPSRPEKAAQPPTRSQSVARTARTDYTTATDYQTSVGSAEEQLDHRTPSMPVELNGLWNAAQGAHPVNGDGKVFIMNIFRQAWPPSNYGPLAIAEHFSFGPTLTTSFYALQTSAVPHSAVANEVTVRRQNPATGDSNSVITMNISLDGTPSSDGLVTLICPKRAVIQAMRESVAHLPDNIKTQAAVNVAAETEMCKLVWSRTNQRYELRHPAIRSRSRVSHAHAIVRDAALVVKIDGKVGFDDPGAKGIIRLVNMTNMETLSTLDLGRNLLFVNTTATSKVPSKHTVDVAVTTVLAVGIVEGRRYRARVLLRPQSLLLPPQRSPVLVSSFSPNVASPHQTSYFVDMRSVNGAMSTHGAGTVRSVTPEWEVQEKEKKPQSLAVKAGKGVWYVIYFIGRLAYEIGKAIVDAFRPVPKSKSKNSASDIESKG